MVVRLLNLETGEVIADTSFENPQRFGGSDIMARIQYDTEDGTRVLQRTLAGYLGRAIAEFPVEPHSIYELVLAGNSTMRDLFFRLDVHPIGQSPYQSITELDVAAGRRTTTSLAETAQRLGLPIHPKARVYGLPIISGHVGADAAACMLAIDLAHESRVVAIMDIGTNTELIVGNRDRVFAASCPAGPAFEGGQITFGMPGLPGAIEKVVIDDDGNLRTTVIGDGPPEGICGSGLVDLLGELRRTGRMNELGRFEDGSDAIVVDARGDPPVTFSEGDVNALAQAKGANVAGLQVVFSEYGIRYSDLDVFYLAGRVWPAPQHRFGEAHRPDPESRREAHRPGWQRRHRRCVRRPALAHQARGTGGAGQTRHALPARDASGLFRFLRRRLPVRTRGRRAGGDEPVMNPVSRFRGHA